MRKEKKRKKKRKYLAEIHREAEVYQYSQSQSYSSTHLEAAISPFFVSQVFLTAPQFSLSYHFYISQIK